MEKIYIDERGWQYAVRTVLVGHVYIVMHRMAGERWRQAHVLPWFANKQEAEDELARWAAKKHMRCMEG